MRYPLRQQGNTTAGFESPARYPLRHGGLEHEIWTRLEHFQRFFVQMKSLDVSGNFTA